MSHPTTIEFLPASSAIPAASGDAREESDALRLNGAAVLIVDEDPAFQLGLKTFLKEYVGFSEVHTARDGVEALARIADTPSIEIITLDYKMPRMNGLEFLDQLKDRVPRPMSVIMITGYPSDQLEEQFHALRSPMLQTEHFLPKSIEFEKLESVILDSYESLKRAQAASPVNAPTAANADAAPLVAALSSQMESTFRRVMDRIDQLEAQVAALTKAQVQVQPQPALPAAAEASPVEEAAASPVPAPIPSRHEAFQPMPEPSVARLAKTLIKGMLLIFFAWAVVRHGLLDRMLEGLGFDPEAWFRSLGRPPAP